MRYVGLISLKEGEEEQLRLPLSGLATQQSGTDVLLKSFATCPYYVLCLI